MASSPTDFVHLHLHTDYSLLDGACKCDRLMDYASSLGMQALAITDHGNLFGLIDFYKNAQKKGLKPLLGCEVYLVIDHDRTEKPGRDQHKYYHMGLLAKSYRGYQNLTRLVSDSHVNGFYYKPRTDLTRLAEFSEDLIGFTGCLQGVVPQMLLRHGYEKAREWMGQFIEIFGKENYIVELQDHGLDEQRQINPDLLKLAGEFGLKVVCTNDVHYVAGDDTETHDALLCIQTGARVTDEQRMRYAERQFYLKTPEEMGQLFGERPELLTNTQAVAEMCEVALPFGENHYPVFPLPPAVQSKGLDNAAYLKQLCVEGLAERYGVDYHHPETYEESGDDPAGLAHTLCERLDYELGVIAQTVFIDYFLIVADFIVWSREQGIPVGPGRGSGAGCLVAYVTKITDIDPIRFGLLFERFLNPERVSPPDFDIDFCMRRRDEVVSYVRDKYGHDSVANIITFGTFGAKMVVRDVARVLDLPYAEGDRLAKMIPDDLGTTLETALERSKELRDEVERNETAKRIVDHGRIIEGMVRNTGRHAAGVIIADRPLDQLVPLTVQEGALTTQYPKDPVEDLGLLKMDFLGLKTLTIIDDAQTNVRRTVAPEFDVEKVALDDATTFTLLNSGRTVGVFQLESGGMQALCRQFNMSKIEEIVALIALYRPGPMEWIPDYVKGKNDPATIQFPHPLLEEVCRETYGVMVYQEQVMEAARRIAGFTLGGADILRRAMGKKKVEVMEEQRQIFIDGAKKHNDIDRTTAQNIFAILEKFAGYGFNKSHSAAYAILSYRTAYLKANYPVQFMAAVLSSELGKADKVAHFIDECSAMGVPVLGPDVNESREDFTPVLESKAGKAGTIRFGLGAIKGVGEAAARRIIEEREASGPYRDFPDLIARVDTKACNKRVLECLIKAGAFDFSGEDRGSLLDGLDGALESAASLQRDRAQGQTSLFDDLLAVTEPPPAPERGAEPATAVSRLSETEKLQFERELLGFYVSGHPLDPYAGLDEAIDSFTGEEHLHWDDFTGFRLCGVIGTVQKRLSRRDNSPWAIVQVGTRKANYSMNCYSRAFARCGHLLEPGALLIVQGTSRKREDEVTLSIDTILPLPANLPELITTVQFELAPDESSIPFVEELRASVDQAQRAESHDFGSTKIAFSFALGDQILEGEAAPSLRCQVAGETFAHWQKHPAVRAVRARATPLAEPEKPSWMKERAAS